MSKMSHKIYLDFMQYPNVTKRKMNSGQKSGYYTAILYLDTIECLYTF